MVHTAGSMPAKDGTNDYYGRIMGGLAMPPVHISNAIPIISKLGYRETRDDYDWVPGEVAYAEYVKACGTAFAPLEMGEFSFAFRLAFPEGERCRRRRASDGRSMRGWSGITGPGAERSTDSDQWKSRRRAKHVDDS